MQRKIYAITPSSKEVVAVSYIFQNIYQFKEYAMVKCPERLNAEVLYLKQDIRGLEITFRENWRIFLGKLL